MDMPALPAMYADIQPAHLMQAGPDSGPVTVRVPMGWLPPDARTKEQNEFSEVVLGSLPPFGIMNATGNDDRKRIILADYWRHPAVVAALGYEFPRFHQFTGSCVGVGFGDMGATLSMLEAIKHDDPEKLFIPFWPYTYGKSRQRGGMRGQGEGSFGAAAAEAALKDGMIRAGLAGLPEFKNGDGLELSKTIELQWSDGAAIPQTYSAEGVQHPIKTISRIRSYEDVREAIRNDFPCTDACSGFVGRATVKGVGKDARVVGDVDSNGGHQTSILGWEEHPTFGEMFLYCNQWPRSVYPFLEGFPPCSVWISAKRMDWICKTGEVFSFSGYEGYPAKTFSWSM